jgi:hypothetical protein
MASTARPVRAAGAGDRTLELETPFMSGPDVLAAQRLLAGSAYGDFRPGPLDSVYGPLTAVATRRAKLALGYPKLQCNEAYGPVLRMFLEGHPLPSEFEARREDRLRRRRNEGAVRAAVVANARWGIEHEAQIHYEEVRPIAGLDDPRSLPLTTDCSGFVTLCYSWAGGPDPNGNDYSGEGYTGTMLAACLRITPQAARPGDLVVWGPPPGHHVALLLEPGPDPLLCSHGEERGPIAIRLSAEGGRQPAPATWLTAFD